MGGRGSKSGLTLSPLNTAGGGPQIQPPQPLQQQPQPPQQPPIQPPIAPQPDAQGFSDTDTADFHELYNGRQYFMSQSFDIDTQMALDDYLSDQPIPGSMYSPSQDLNFRMNNDPTYQSLSSNQRFMIQSLMNGMHNLGYNLTLTRYQRVDFMQRLGAANFSNMTAQQLQKALVGKTFTEAGFVSTSYNQFRTAPTSNPFTDKTVKINYKAPAKTQALMPGNGPGGALGEIVLAPNQTYEITGVRFTGQKGRSGSQYYNQVEIDITVK